MVVEFSDLLFQANKESLWPRLKISKRALMQQFPKLSKRVVVYLCQ